MEEYIDLVNENDEVIGSEEKMIVYKSGTKNFRTINVFFVNSNGEILIQRRSNNRKLFPGMWDFSAAGRIKSGEDYKHSAVRETEEELGVKVPLKEVAYLSPYKLNISSFKKIFVAHYDGDFNNYDNDGIAELFYMNPEEIKNKLEEADNLFLPDYKEVFSYLYEHNLFER